MSAIAPTDSPAASRRDAVDARELSTAHDPAAVLTWRLPHPDTTGPLPWLTGIPTELAQHPLWSDYLTARQNLIRDLADALAAVDAVMVRLCMQRESTGR